jgi:uncharacterized protein (TIGR03435 family)
MLLSLTLGMLIAAQGAAPAFDVATIKPVELTPGNYNANLGSTSHGTLQMTNVTLSDCLRFAYTISNDVQIEGPAWIRNKDIRFDVTAKTAPDTPRAQMLLMLQRLLTERFQLAMHHEQKERSYLALSSGKNALKMLSVPADAPNPSQITVSGRIISQRMPMSILVTLLSRFTGQPVVDMTGLDGFYKLHLEWTPESLTPSGATDPAAGGPSVYTAVQEQLGLKLESHKGPLDVLIVDHAEKVPAAN